MLPREIQVERWPERSTYDLPLRPIGKLRYVGLVLIGFAVLFAWMPGGQVARAVRRALAGNASPADLVFGAFTLLFVVAALLPFAMGMFMLCGRTRLVVNRDWLRVTELAMFFRWSRRVKLADVKALQVAAANEKNPGGTAAAPGFAKLGALGASLRNQKTMLLLIGYPRDWLNPIAEELSGLIQLKGSPVTIEQIEPTRGGSPVRNDEIEQQPASSNARLTATAGSVELDLPSKGFWKESGGLLVFSGLWCGFMVVFTSVMGVSTFKSHTHLSAELGLLAFLAVFWAVGLGMALLAVHLGTRRWTVKADDRHLEATVRSAVRSRSWHWDASDIRELVVGDSHVEVNNRRLQELQVHPRAGKKTGLLRGRDPEELAWTATKLRRVLKVAATTDKAALAR